MKNNVPKKNGVTREFAREMRKSRHVVTSHQSHIRPVGDGNEDIMFGRNDDVMKTVQMCCESRHWS